MPRLTGLQAAAEINRERPELRVLMLSMHDNEQYLFEALNAGASGYVLKTAADRDLVEACRAVLRGEPFLYPSGIAALIRDFLDRARDGEAVPADPLTPRELEVVKLVAEAHTSEQIAAGAGDQPQDRRAPPREPHGQARHARPRRADPLRDQARPDRAIATGASPTTAVDSAPPMGNEAHGERRRAAHDGRVARLLIAWSRPRHVDALSWAARRSWHRCWSCRRCDRSHSRACIRASPARPAATGLRTVPPRGRRRRDLVDEPVCSDWIRDMYLLGLRPRVVLGRRSPEEVG